MKKIVRLTESELISIVKRVINEEEESNKKFCAYGIPEWKEIDDDVKQDGNWSLEKGKIKLKYTGFIANLLKTVDYINKPKGFDAWRGSATKGTIKKSYEQADKYEVCFYK